MTLSVNCLIIGDNPIDEMFTVTISDGQNIYGLKERIRAAMVPRLNDIPSTQLDLWKVSLALDNVGVFVPDDKAKLVSVKRLNGIFKNERDDHIHIIVAVRGMSY
jgi:hypothetical protein